MVDSGGSRPSASGGGGGGHPDPEIKGSLQKKILPRHYPPMDPPLVGTGFGEQKFQRRHIALMLTHVQSRTNFHVMSYVMATLLRDKEFVTKHGRCGRSVKPFVLELKSDQSV